MRLCLENLQSKHNSKVIEKIYRIYDASKIRSVVLCISFSESFGQYIKLLIINNQYRFIVSRPLLNRIICRPGCVRPSSGLLTYEQRQSLRDIIRPGSKVYGYSALTGEVYINSYIYIDREPRACHVLKENQTRSSLALKASKSLKRVTRLWLWLWLNTIDQKVKVTLNPLFVVQLRGESYSLLFYCDDFSDTKQLNRQNFSIFANKL